MDEKYLWPLVGVFLGWLLSSIATGWKQRVDFWGFDCKYGHSEQEARVIHLSQINKCIDQAEQLRLDSFYLEILVKLGHRVKKQDPSA